MFKKLLLALLVAIICKQTTCFSLAQLFTARNKILSEPKHIYSLSNEEDEILEQPQLPGLPAWLFLQPQANAARNANGQGRIFGALFAFRDHANRKNAAGAGGIVINTPVNLTNINSNTPMGTFPTTSTFTLPTAGTRLQGHPVRNYYDGRSPDLSNLEAAPLAPQVMRVPVRTRRRRRPFRQNINPQYVQYLKK